MERSMGKLRAEIRSMPTNDGKSEGLDPSSFLHRPKTSNTVKSTSIWTQRKRSMWAISWSAAFFVGILAMFTTYYIVPSSWATISTPSYTLMIPVPPSPSNEKILSFLHWFHTAGGVANKVTITTFPHMGRGILATGSIHEHDLLLTVPKHLILCRETILQQVKAMPNLVQKFQKLSDRSEELLTAFLFLEQVNTTTYGFWDPYLQLLPSSTSDVMTPLLYPNESTIHQLQDESMIAAATAERKQAKLAYQRFRRLFRSFLPTSNNHFSLYQWTRFLIQSRAFSIQGQRYLVPYGDFFNNQPHPQPRVMSNGQAFLRYHQLDALKGMEIRSDRLIERGEQVLEDYGDNTNDIYFLYHGFIQENNPFDCTNIHLPVLSLSLATDEDATVGQSKLAVLRHYKIDNGPQVCITRHGKMLSKHDEWVWEMYGYLSRLDNKEMQVCGHRGRYEYCFGALDGKKRPRQRRSDTHKAQQLEFLLKGIKLQLSKYPTTSLQDEALFLRITDNKEETSLKHAIRFRLHRKQVLQSAIATLTRRLHQVQEEKRRSPLSKVDDVDTSLVSLEDRMNRFNEWVQHLELPTNHLRVGYVDEISGYGVYTTKVLEKGEVYLRVPTKYVLDVDSAIDSVFIQELLTQDIELNDFELLLVHLLDEKFSATSRWKPYLDVLPDPSRLTSTSLYYEETGPELELLSHASLDLYHLIKHYRKQVEVAFTTLTTRLNHLETKPQFLTKENIQWAMAMMDSRSIWWSGQRHLVPLLDMVNCMEVDGKRQSLHTTTLETVLLEDGEEENVAVTRSSWAFGHGAHLVENYGQPNYIYLLYHGFVLSRNSHDCAHYRFDFHSLSMEKGAKRTEAIKTLEGWGLFTWTPDVCVTPHSRSNSGSSTHTVETLIQVAALTESQVDASSFHMAALKSTRTRLDRITKTLQAFELNEMYTNTMVWKYLQQQQQLFKAIERVIIANY